MKSNCKIIVTIEFFVQNGPWNMCQTTNLKVLGLVTFSDLTSTLTWAKYETISLDSTFAWSFGAYMNSFGRKMLRLRSLRSATWLHPILTFDLTLTWHVTSILTFRKWFGSVSSRSFDCRIAHLSTTIRFVARGSDPTPPRLWWVQKQPRRLRIKPVFENIVHVNNPSDSFELLSSDQTRGFVSIKWFMWTRFRKPGQSDSKWYFSISGRCWFKQPKYPVYDEPLKVCNEIPFCPVLR